jgi:CHAT domain-containing protein
MALSRGFLIAGARAVVASQWAVNDASTAVLIGRLFERIADDERHGRRPRIARALRDAAREVRRRPGWSDPFHWAPFVLTGTP